MRNLIIALLISFTCFGQGNLITREIFGNKNTKKWNTFIGGVSSTISTSAQLATKLGISNNRIRNFVVVGSDIKCKITGSYAIPAEVFDFNYTPCSFYKDTDYLVSSVGSNSFYYTNIAGVIDFQNATSVSNGFKGTPLLTAILLKNCTSVGDDGFAESTNGTRTLKTCYIPNVTSLGSTSGNNGVFAGNCTGLKIYAHPSLATNNGGAPDNDIAFAISQGATVRYVTNFTSPNPVTSLSTGTITSTSIQFNFTDPTGSTNAYDFSEIYKKDINGNWLYISDIVSGGIVSGLTTSTTYDFKIVARDIFYNGAESFTTASTL